MSDTMKHSPSAPSTQPGAGGGAQPPRPPQAPAPSPAPEPGPTRAQRIIHGLTWIVPGLLLLLVVVVIGLWVWSGSQSSLAQAIALAQRLVPAASALQTTDVEGSLRDGGRIGSLRWSQPEGVSVAVDGLQIAWQPLALLAGTVRVNTLTAESVRIVNRTPESASAEPSQPLKSLVLPVRVEIPQIRLERFGWNDPESFGFEGLEASYAYNGLTHELQINAIAIADGQYSLHAKMASQAPLNLVAELQGKLQAPMPEGEQPLPLTLQARVDGPLELLDIRAQAQVEPPAAATADKANADAAGAGTGAAAQTDAAAAPASTTTSAAASAQAPSASPDATAAGAPAAPQAIVTAQIAPWQAGFPILKADVSLSRLNLRAFLPSLPVTGLDGQARITPRPAPDATAPASAPASEPGTTAPALPPLDIQADIRNSLPGPWDRQRLPFERILLDGGWRQDSQGQSADVRQLQIALGGKLDGELSGSGTFSLTPSGTPAASAQTGTAPASATPAPAAPTLPATSPATSPAIWQARADLRLQGVNPQAIYSTLAAAPLTGTLSARTRDSAASTPASASASDAGTASAQPGVDFDVDITGKPPARGRNLLWLQRLAARGAWADDTISLASLNLASNQARVQGSGRYGLASQAAAAQASLSIPGLQGQVNGSISPNQGQGRAALTLANAGQALAWARSLPGMGRLLAGQQLSGNARLDAQWQGGWNKPTLDATLDVPRLALAPSGAPSSKGGSAQPLSVSALQARLQGRLDQASLVLQGQARAAGQRAELAARLNGGNKAPAGQPARWVVNVEQLRASADDFAAPAGATPGLWTLQTTQPLNLVWRGQTLEASSGSARLSAPPRVTRDAKDSLPITWEALRLRTSAQGLAELRTAGAIEGLPFAWANAISHGKLAAAGLSGDLSLNANWDIDLGRSLAARIAIERAGGDLDLISQDSLNDVFALAAEQATTPAGRGTTKFTLIDPQVGAASVSSKAGEGEEAAVGRRLTVGIKTARVVLTANDTQLDAALDWDTQRLGQASAQVSSPISRAGDAWQWAENAPLSGKLQASLTRLGIWSSLAPPGWRVRGQLQADATIGGTRAAPLLRGVLRGSDLALRSVLDGVELANGQFQATLDGSRMTLDNFSLAGAGGGNVTAQGQADWSSGAPDMRVEASINQLRVTNRADRQVTASGKLLATLAGKDLALSGRVVVDRARIVLPESSTPTLGSDVRVADPTRAEAEAALRQDNAQAIEPRVDVTLDMGNDFRLRGYGINTGLRGQLKVSMDRGAPRVNGDINTAGGEFRAYGQWLDIERGVIRFTGPADNPSLDVLAIRPRLTQRVGVQVTGPAISPVIRLYADPELADSEKLAWLLLGRSGASGGAEAAMLQQAAVAALSGGSSGPGIAGLFGLDQLSVGGTKNEAGETEASLTVGKQIARDIYVTYERTLSGALGTLYVFYDLSKRWTLRGQSGEDSAVDLIFTLPYDAL